MHVLRYGTGCFWHTFRHCDVFFKKIQIFWVPTAHAYIYYACGYLIRLRIFYYGADTVVTECYVKSLCNSLKELIRKYTNEQTIKTIIKIYKCKGFVCIPSSSAILLG